MAPTSEKSGKNTSRKRLAAASSTADATPITQDGNRPQKKFYRQRAHCNPLSHNDSFEYPFHPDGIDWTVDHFPCLPNGTVPTVLDIGCGFGGLLMGLGRLLPSDQILGMEIRSKVAEYVRLRIAAARKEHTEGLYQNCSVLRTNSMKFLPNYFRGASIDKMFFCFPDPHFKRKNHPRRIISELLLSEYAFLLKPGVGRLYCITDVKELHDWHVRKCDGHRLFRRVSTEQIQQEEADIVQAMESETEEGKKVSREGGSKYWAVYQRIANEDACQVHSGDFFSAYR